jgi:hypothetical protein
MLYLAVLNRMYDVNTSIITQTVFLSCVYAMVCREDAIGGNGLDSIAVAPHFRFLLIGYLTTATSRVTPSPF